MIESTTLTRWPLPKHLDRHLARVSACSFLRICKLAFSRSDSFFSLPKDGILPIMLISFFHARDPHPKAQHWFLFCIKDRSFFFPSEDHLTAWPLGSFLRFFVSLFFVELFEYSLTQFMQDGRTSCLLFI